ncbi:TonB-dependent receptor [Aestuariicella hydrocarbonica]|uniref:TonB-dependent receptor n=1 Tax=Pseudomaricurvus hydrocarbonicus TaxID=1470433 RepID=A0A9E5MQH1_9GAMM|nr:TonB-dependent receptor [Aestuariicella hydrocarbonica]NHO68546.1 TonB-dependent receptor [Aestuariicella hydrocarbonica]
MSEHTFLTTSLSLAVGLALSAGAAAQTDPPTRKGAAARMMEEVTVTARKRSEAEKVQDVPIAITALGADQIDAMYVKDMTDLGFTMPSVQTDESGTLPGVQNFTIRGQGINSSIPSVDPTVGVFIDGVFMGVSHGVIMDMFDVESIEMLRGPQGLLFGRNVTGGAVVMRTARPDGEFGFKARTRVSTGLEKNVALSVQGGLTDTLAGKLTLYYNDDEGYWKNTTDTRQTDQFWGPDGLGLVDFDNSDPRFRSKPADGGDTGARTTEFARGTLVWNPTETLDLTLITEFGNMDGDGPVWTTRESLNNGTLDSDETAQDENGYSDVDWKQATLEMNWNIGNGTLTNILGYRDLNSDARTDIDALSAPLFNVPGLTEQDQISNELRYAFTSDNDKWDVTTGLYYFQQDIKYREQRWGGLGILLGAQLPVINTVNLGGDMDHETWGLFGSVDYRITDRLTLTAGLRYTKEEKDAAVINADPNAGGSPCQDPTFSSCVFDSLSDTWENWTPKLGANWMMTEDTMLYASYTKGFRSGGVNFRNALPSIVDPGPTNEEEQDAFEIGFKSDLIDGRLRLNGAAYYVMVSDMQRELNVGASEIPLIGATGVLVWQATVNAGDVDIAGAELEAVALLTENFSINASVGYVDSEYDSYTDQVINAEARIFTETGQNVTLVGEDLPRLSPWTASLGATYDLDLDNLGLLTFRGSYSYRDPAAYNDSNTLIYESKRMVNASVQWSSPQSAWTVSAYGKNLNDEVRWGSLNGLIETSGGATKGRTYGIEATYNY